MNLDVIESYMGGLCQHGYTITYDWTNDVKNAGSGSPDDATLRARCAANDLGGVERAEVFWLIHPETFSTGSFVELGSALTLRRVRALMGIKKPLIVVSGTSKKCIFADYGEGLADHRFDDHEEAFDFLVSLKLVAEDRHA